MSWFWVRYPQPFMQTAESTAVYKHCWLLVRKNHIKFIYIPHLLRLLEEMLKEILS